MGKVIYGDHTYGGPIEFVGGTIGTVTVGKYCSIGAGVKAFMSQDHNIENISTFPFGHKGMKITGMMKPPLPNKSRYNTLHKLEIKIGNDVFIGSEAILFRDITIGDGAVIGAYSRITKDVEPYTVVVGDNRVVKKRFSDRDIEFLLKLKWWDFDDEMVADIANILCSPNMENLRSWNFRRTLPKQYIYSPNLL